MTDALCIQMPALIKAVPDTGGRRLVEVQASSEAVDSEGDVILQAALLNSAKAFVQKGHIDLDHISEIGGRLGIRNPSDYIIGVPVEVKDIGDRKTSVVVEVFKSKDGSFDPEKNRFDGFWKSLQSEPPVRWRSSIYGFPTHDGLIDCTVQRHLSKSELHGATRYLVKAMDWKSLAFTLNPVNDSLEGAARIVSAKAFVRGLQGRLLRADDPLRKSEPVGLAYPEKFLLPPRNREELMGHYVAHMETGACPYAGGDGNRSVFSFREHFTNCCCEPEWEADLQALALMQLLKRR